MEIELEEVGLVLFRGFCDSRRRKETGITPNISSGQACFLLDDGCTEPGGVRIILLRCGTKEIRRSSGQRLISAPRRCVAVAGVWLKE